MGASNYVLQCRHYTSSATRLQAFNRKNFTPILRIPIIGFFPPSILLENSIPASRSGVVKSIGGMMELRLSNDVTMGKSSRNTADVGFILRLCSNAPTFLRFRRRERFWSQCECCNNTNKFLRLDLKNYMKAMSFLVLHRKAAFDIAIPVQHRDLKMWILIWWVF